jgi:glycosyltransferase involved in cell wall biosynthesis
VRKHTILHTIETAGPGGAETILLNLAAQLDASRFRSVVLIPRRDWLYQRLQEAGIRTLVARSQAWYDFRLLRSLVKLARREKVDLIHSHLPDQNFYGCLAGRLTGRKTVVTYHGSQQLSVNGGTRSASKLWFVRHTAAAAVAVSDHVRKMLENVGFPKEKIVRIHNGIECSRFDATTPGGLREQLGYQNGTRLVGVVANLRDSKGYDYFVRAARLVADSVSDARFVAVGEIDTRSHRELWGLVRQLQLQDRFCFLGFRPDVAQILADLDVFVLSSVSEGFSLATVEAMAAGKPVVVTRAGGPEEIVEDEQTGFLVPPADAAALARRICDVLNNRDLASALGRRAKAMVQTRFGLRHMVSEYEALYERCLSAC